MLLLLHPSNISPMQYDTARAAVGHLKKLRCCACCSGVPRLAKFAVVMALDLPVPRWSMSTTLKLFTADLSQPEASLGRGDSKPGPPEVQGACRVLENTW
jgi:hypothetical protein